MFVLEIFWSTIFPAVIAGGLAGQLVTVFGGSWLTQRREQKKWLVSERYKCFSELLSVATVIPKSEDDRNSWTYQIRDCSQRMHVLFKGGTAPHALADALEELFQLARERKDGVMRDDWSDLQRENVRVLRCEMANSLTSD